MDPIAPGKTSAPEELRILLRLAAPIAATQSGFALMGLVDTAVVGRLGAAQLGSIALANGLFFTVAVMGIGVMMGLDPLFAQAFGARDARRAHELIWQTVWLSLLATAVLSLPVALMPYLLPIAGTDPDIANPASAYLLLRLFGLWPMFLFAGLRAYLQAAHTVRVLLVATIVANVINFLLDVWWVYGGFGVPALGGPGSGLATAVASFAQAAILFAVVPRGGKRALHWPDLRKALGVGVPVGLQLGAEVSIFALVGVLASRLGAIPLAAHQIAITLASFTFCVAVGFGEAGSVRVGWAIGARDTPAARRSGLLAFAAGAGVMSVAALAFWLVPVPLVRMLSDQEPVIAATIPLLAVCAVFQLSDGIQAVGAGVLRGAGDSRYAFVANVLGHYGAGFPIAIALGIFAGMGVIGLWWGLCAGLTAVAAALLTRFLRLSSREIAPLEEHPGSVPPVDAGSIPG